MVMDRVAVNGGLAALVLARKSKTVTPPKWFYLSGVQDNVFMSRRVSSPF